MNNVTVVPAVEISFLLVDIVVLINPRLQLAPISVSERLIILNQRIYPSKIIKPQSNKFT